MKHLFVFNLFQIINYPLISFETVLKDFLRMSGNFLFPKFRTAITLCLARPEEACNAVSKGLVRVPGAHSIKYSLSLMMLLALTGCGKKQTPPNSIPGLPPAHLSVPATLSQGLCITKQHSSHTRTKTGHELEQDALQIALGLRDAVREKPHIIPALARGYLFKIKNMPVKTTLKSTYTVGDQHVTTEVSTSYKNFATTHSISAHNYEPQPMPLQTTLVVTPQEESASFDNDLLERVFDTLQAGYASNEISITLSFNNQIEKLCRQGCDMTMNISLQPNAITYQIDNYGLNPCVFLTTVCDIPQTTASQQKKETILNKNILFVLMPRGFQDLEFTNPYNALSKAGYAIDIAGLTSGSCVGSAGTTVTPTKILSAMTLADFNSYDALIIPGGNESPTFLWNNEELQAVVRYFHEHKKLVATICYASIIPAQAGILNNCEATVYPTEEAKNLFTENNVIFNNNLCVSLDDKKIITAQSPQAIEPFIASILKQLEMQPTQKEPLHA